ncbi:WD40/YVTN/BNR-like repeat-containing protein [Geotalea uraniireducens]|nr:hypothetical protein [Geotalea uraniireducens]
MTKSRPYRPAGWLAAAFMAAWFGLTPATARGGSFFVGAQNDNGSGDAMANCASSGNSDCTLSSAIQAANNAGPGPHTITLVSNVALTGRMRRLIEQSVTIAPVSGVRSVSCSAGSSGRPFLIGGALAGTTTGGVVYPPLNNLNVTLKGITVNSCMVKGGDSGQYGGAGAGLGGALFVYGGNVTLENISFTNNGAQGGGVTLATNIGGAGMLGASTSAVNGGGGLWADAADNSGACSGLGDYADCTVTGFGGGAAAASATGSSGGPGQFGGGGSPGSGGFGGGSGGGGGTGGYANTYMNAIYFGGARTPGATGGAGAGAGMGGAIFVRSGLLTLKKVSFSGNSATAGSGGQNAAAGYGGALFVCTSDLDNDSSASGAKGSCSAAIDLAGSCGVSFNGNIAGTGNADYYWNGNATALSAIPACPATGPVSSIVVDPLTSTILYAGLDGVGIYRSADRGATWSVAAQQPASLRVKALTIDKSDTTRLYAASYGGGMFKSTDSGGHWAACSTQPPNLNVLSLGMDKNGKLFAGTEAGAFVSNNGCGTWAVMTRGLP